MPFVKLDCHILDKSIWSESAEIKVVWITMLAMADSDGIIEAAIPGIASRSKISLELTENAIEKFQQPDKYSSDPSNEGRRIEKIDGGYKILNCQQYRDKDYTAAARQRKHRELSRVTSVTSPRTYMSYASDVLSYLNLKTEKKYKNNKEILKRLVDGHTVDELKSIIDTKIHDPHFIENPQYLNPVTLFRKCHIDNYLNQKPEDFKSNKKQSTAWGGIAENTDQPKPTVDKKQNLIDKIKAYETAEKDIGLDEPSKKLLEIWRNELADIGK
jgi:uncharacterized phage protein (TIGR02220 family)